MTWSSDSAAPRDRGVWAVIAAVILAFQGLTMIAGAGILRPVGGVAVDLPILGHVAVAYLVAGALALIACAGVALRRSWGRWLGIASEAVTLVLLLLAASNASLVIMAPLLPAIVVFGLWRHWPEPGAPDLPATAPEAADLPPTP